jgi:RimJ/RimL family protein N-acetyltransferase
MTHGAPVIVRPAAKADIPGVLRLISPDAACPLTAGDYRARLADGQYRPEWTWLAECPGSAGGDDGPRAAGIWWGRPGDAVPEALDALFTDARVPRAERAALCGRLLAAAHRAFNPVSRTVPAFHLFLPPDWRARRDVITALRWRWEAALGAGLTEELERVRFEWTIASGVPGPSNRLRFRPEPDDDAFAGLFARTLADTLDATSKKAADAVGAAAQARADVAFYRDKMLGRREWWRVAETSDGEPAGFTVPSRNSDHAVVGYIGVLPGHRGHGYIDDILAETTRILVAEADADVIRADTDLANRPMAAAFGRAGYRDFARRVVLSAP